MRKSVLLIAVIFLSTICFAQVKDPVKWSFSSKKVDKTTHIVHLTATIDQGWHIYSQTTPEGGPIPTSISFTKNPLITIDGETQELGKLEKHHEPLFGVEVKQFSNKVIFVQKIKLKSSVKTSLNGSVEFMVCNDHECLPPSTEKFSIELK